ncbi:MAG: hypothetical protein JRD68_16290 [Deltaproteobacteria bacterium]|nr:hypothetical protein [Deltaproteobacteria bacterium]
MGDDKYDSGPLIKYPFELLSSHCPQAYAFDLYAGCPGFNVGVELIYMLSQTGILKRGDLSIIIGAENLHRAKSFRPDDTSNIIFGDDALATALETRASLKPSGDYSDRSSGRVQLGEDFITGLAEVIIELTGGQGVDGIIIDNQLGQTVHRIPASAVRVQHRMAELQYPDEAEKGTLTRFKDALAFFDEHVDSFAFDIMGLTRDPDMVKRLARAYVESGKYGSVVSAYLLPDLTVEVILHKGAGFTLVKPEQGVIDTRTRTHGCFADYIMAEREDDDVFGLMDGKGVFLYATRSAKPILSALLADNDLTLNDIDLLIEHQANFAMIPLTLQQVLAGTEGDLKEVVGRFLAEHMVMNIHESGNCSVVCMQRLPYDLERGALKPGNVQGFEINSNLDRLKDARTIIFDSVGSGMTRSSFLRKL